MLRISGRSWVIPWSYGIGISPLPVCTLDPYLSPTKVTDNCLGATLSLCLSPKNSTGALGVRLFYGPTFIMLHNVAVIGAHKYLHSLKGS